MSSPPGNEMLSRQPVVNSWTSFVRQLDDCLQEGKTPVVLLDEMSNISPQWEAILLKLSESKISSDWQIKGPLRFVAAGNPPEDSRTGQHFKAAFDACLYGSPFHPNLLDYAEREKSNPPSVFYEFAAETVINYLVLYPDQFVPPPSALNSQNPLLCPRNWTMATNYYSMLLQSEAERLGLPEDALKSAEALRALAVNQEELRNWLLPVLPPDTVKGFTAFVSLNSIITGDEIIVHGKPAPTNLTSEQVKIILQSATASLARHVAQAEEEYGVNKTAAGLEKDEKLAEALVKYTTNFMNFVDTLGTNPSVNQQLDSLMMPNLDNLETVLKALHRFTGTAASNLRTDHAGAFLDVSRRIMGLYGYIYNHSDNPSATTLSQSSSPTTSPFLTAGVPPRHKLSGGGIS